MRVGASAPESRVTGWRSLMDGGSAAGWTAGGGVGESGRDIAFARSAASRCSQVISLTNAMEAGLPGMCWQERDRSRKLTGVAGRVAEEERSKLRGGAGGGAAAAAVVRLLLVPRLGTAEARPGWNGALLLQGEIGGGGVNTLAEGEDDL